VAAFRVAVLGAGGTIGPAIARDLAASEEVAEVRLLDLDESKCRAVAETIQQGEVSIARADATAGAGEPDSLVGALADSDVLVNSASYRVNIEAMRASLGAGCHYLDLGGLYWMTAEQLRRFAPQGGEDEFEAAGLLAVLGIGSAPGKTNLMAKLASRELGEVEALHVSAAGRDLEPPPGFSVPYALQTLLDELTMPPVAVSDGEAIELEAMSPGGTVDFGEPIGESDTIYTLHSEMLTFPDSFGCREGSFRLSLHPGLLERLRALAAAGADEVARAAAEAVPPSRNTVAVHLVEAAGGGTRVRVRAVTRPVDELGAGGGVTSTAAPAPATIRLLARGRIPARGVHPPERCIDPDELFPELERRGSEFDVEVREEARA
jgi:saccharopine dehydrogenase-like NADP-dependent oxidoreductase